MIIDITKLNSLEKDIYDTLIEYCKTNSELKIIDAANLCNVSTSKISKLSKKLGFKSYKQFISFALGNVPESEETSGEIARLKKYLDEFDATSIPKCIDKIVSSKRIILLGLGPSAYCAQYMEYKLRVLMPDKQLFFVPDMLSAESLVEENTLLIIFSTTGHFRSFGGITDYIRSHGGHSILIIEEYNPDLIKSYEEDTLIFLSSSRQSHRLKAHEKSRVITFIYIEELLFTLMERMHT